MLVRDWILQGAKNAEGRTGGPRVPTPGTPPGDLEVAAAPKLVRTVPLYSSPTNMHTAGNTVLLALGFNGVQRIDL